MGILFCACARWVEYLEFDAICYFWTHCGGFSNGWSTLWQRSCQERWKVITSLPTFLTLWISIVFVGTLDEDILNKYWMRLSMISCIIKTEVCVICRSRRLRQISQAQGFDNSWYHAKIEFNNCFIIHFEHNSSSETEAKRSAILFLRRTL